MASFAGPNLIKDNLAFLYDAANTESYPGSGNHWYDLHRGRGIHDASFRTSANSLTTLSSSTDNKGILILSGSKWIRINSLRDEWSNRQKDYTFQIWCRPNYTLDGTRGNVLLSFHDTGTNRMRWQVKSNAVFAGGAPLSSTEKTMSHKQLAAGEWHFYTMVGDYGNNKCFWYLDTELVGSQNMNASDAKKRFNPINRVSLGQEWDAGGTSEFFEGAMSLFVGYNTALTESQVKQNYHAYKGRFGL